MNSKILKCFKMGLCVGGLLLATSQMARANLVGDTVSCSVSGIFPSITCSSLTAGVVGAGVEFTIDSGGFAALSIDISASSVTITNILLQTFVTPGFINLSGLEWVNDPTGVITGTANVVDGTGLGILAPTIFGPLPPSGLSIEIPAGTWNFNAKYSFDIITNDVTTPHQSGWLMLLFSSMALGYLGLRRCSQSVRYGVKS